MLNDQKLLSFAIEKQSQHMIDLTPKMDTTFHDDSIVSLILKGVSIKQTNLNNYHYFYII
jgi:hypothetical protein